MAEEVHNPSEILPRAISWSVPIGAISGVVFLLPILFTLPDVATLLQGVCLYGGIAFVVVPKHAWNAQLALVNRLASCSP